MPADAIASRRWDCARYRETAPPLTATFELRRQMSCRTGTLCTLLAQEVMYPKFLLLAQS